ncbi:hypothetical protein ACFOWB_10115 [Chenggangzhangella methanolivorans]|uniref:hypothetical protein n=1 Tax=Chenggangzhangella methanolivorans TaxID=1437009 RepID=UPI003610FE43
MVYAYIVEKKIRLSFDDVNVRRWDAVVKDMAQTSITACPERTRSEASDAVSRPSASGSSAWGASSPRSA